MSIAFDAATSTGSTANVSFTHTPVGTPRGVIVLVSQRENSSDGITGVTYGGDSLTRSTTAGSATGEAGRVYVYFLGSGVKTGAQTVASVTSANRNREYVAITVTAAANTEVENTQTTNGIQANPSVTLVTGSTVACFDAGVVFSGKSPASNVAPSTGYTEVHEHGWAAQTASMIRRTSNSTGGNVTLGWVISADDTAAAGIAVKEGASTGSTQKAVGITDITITFST